MLESVRHELCHSRGRVGEHAERSRNLGEVASGDKCGRLVADAELRLAANVALRLTLKPVGHQSTNWIVRLVRTFATAALTSLGTTSPRYSRQQAMYLPCLGSHLTIWLLDSKQEIVISETELDSWNAVMSIV